MKILAKHISFKIEKVLLLIEKLEQTNQYKLLHLDTQNIQYIHIECGTVITKTLSYFLKCHGCPNGICKQKLKIKNHGPDFEKKKNAKSHATRKANGNPGYDKAAETWKAKDEIELLKIAQKKHNNKINSIDENGLNAYERATLAVKKTKLENHGDENYNNRSQADKTNRDRYGMGSNGPAISEALLNKSKEEWTEIRNKGQQSCFENNGFRCAFEKKNITAIWQKTLGVNHPSELQSSKDKKRKLFRDRYYEDVLTKLTKVEVLFSKEEYQGNLKPYKFLCLDCNQEFSFILHGGKIPQCTHCFPPKLNQSKIENEIKDWLTQLNISICPNERFYYDGKKYHELDIYLPKENTGVELNGIYYHSEIRGYKNQDYHLNKTNFFKEKNIQVIHIWDREWIERKEIVQSLILSKLNVFANIINSETCNIKEIDSDTSVDFLNKNCIQIKNVGYINIGLFLNNKLVYVCSFAKQNMYELITFSSLLNTAVIDGLSTCIKYFRHKYATTFIFSADKRFEHSDNYLQNNFKLIDETVPNYYYTYDYISLYTQKEIQLEENIEEKITWETMQQNGWDRVWDCGSYVFEYKQ